MKTFAVPYESSIGVKPILVGWCVDCAKNYEAVVYDPYPGPGSQCYNEHGYEYWASKKYGNGETRGLHKRRMYKCPYEYCDFYYLTLKGFIEHEHGML